MGRLVGIREDRGAWQAFVKVRGQFKSKRFPLDTPQLTMQRWRNEQKARAILNLATPSEDGPLFEDDAQAYLQAVSAMPSYSDRALHIEQWTAVFRGRPRSSITPLEIRTQLAIWRKRYAPSSVNKRRTALMNLFTVLDGKSGRNPVRDVPKYREESDIPRAQPLWLLYRLLACMPDTKTRARLRVLLWTGWPHAQIMQLEPEHLDFKRGRAFVKPRRKGKGRAGVWLPLLPGAIVALKAFHAKKCYGPFSQSTMRKLMLYGLKKLNAHRASFEHPPLKIRPYDFRHSFGTFLAEHVSDDRSVQDLMLHSTPQQTRRYTEGATAGRLRAAVAIFQKPVAMENKQAQKH